MVKIQSRLTAWLGYGILAIFGLIVVFGLGVRQGEKLASADLTAKALKDSTAKVQMLEAEAEMYRQSIAAAYVENASIRSTIASATASISTIRETVRKQAGTAPPAPECKLDKEEIAAWDAMTAAAVSAIGSPEKSSSTP